MEKRWALSTNAFWQRLHLLAPPTKPFFRRPKNLRVLENILKITV